MCTEFVRARARAHTHERSLAIALDRQMIFITKQEDAARVITQHVIFHIYNIFELNMEQQGMEKAILLSATCGLWPFRLAVCLSHQQIQRYIQSIGF